MTRIDMQIYQSTFGGRRCEVALLHSAVGPSAIVAWALEVRRDGKLEPLYDHGTMMRESGATADDALAAIKRRLVAMLGTEGPDSPVTFSTDLETSTQTPDPRSSTPSK